MKCSNFFFFLFLERLDFFTGTMFNHGSIHCIHLMISVHRTEIIKDRLPEQLWVRCRGRSEPWNIIWPNFISTVALLKWALSKTIRLVECVDSWDFAEIQNDNYSFFNSPYITGIFYRDLNSFLLTESLSFPTTPRTPPTISRSMLA